MPRRESLGVQLRFQRIGRSVLCVEADEEPTLEVQRRVWFLAEAARAWTGVSCAIPGFGNVSLLCDDGLDIDDAIERVREAWMRDDIPADRATTHAIPVRYDGDDLEDVARACGGRADDVVALHAAREYRVFFLGFKPGFAYLGEIDARLRLARRASPRARVEAGSVAIADRFTGIYPSLSPGGWHVIGHTSVRPFDPSREPMALFAPGDRVRFVPQ